MKSKLEILCEEIRETCQKEGHQYKFIKTEKECRSTYRSEPTFGPSTADMYYISENTSSGGRFFMVDYYKCSTCGKEKEEARDTGKRVSRYYEDGRLVQEIFTFKKLGFDIRVEKFLAQDDHACRIVIQNKTIEKTKNYKYGVLFEERIDVGYSGKDLRKYSKYNLGKDQRLKIEDQRLTISKLVIVEEGSHVMKRAIVISGKDKNWKDRYRHLTIESDSKKVSWKDLKKFPEKSF